MQQRQQAVFHKATRIEDDLDEVSDHNQTTEEVLEVDEDSDDSSKFDELDVMGVIRKRQKKIAKELKAKEIRGEITVNAGIAKIWKDSQLAREIDLRESDRKNVTPIREATPELAERQDREEEKARIVERDPLGINIDEDLKQLKDRQAEQMEILISETQEEILKAENTGMEEAIQKTISQKESVEFLIEKLGGLEAMENQTHSSMLPTSPKFNPFLFLTLLHRKTNYMELQIPWTS